MVNNLLVGGLALVLPMVVGVSAYAEPEKHVQDGIVCNDDFQSVEGRPVDTPYCDDAYLAKVAREYGSKVTASELRNNPNRKAEVCRLVGSDDRVKDTCWDDDEGN